MNDAAASSPTWAIMRGNAGNEGKGKTDSADSAGDDAPPVITLETLAAHLVALQLDRKRSEKHRKDAMVDLTDAFTLASGGKLDS